MLDQHYKVTIQRLQKLQDKTPHCAVMFLGGHLPGKAQLHLRILSLFGMVSRLQGTFFNKIAVHQFLHVNVLAGSWFLQVRSLCILYNLPSPITLLQHPLNKYSYKKLIKSRVIDFWETHLRAEALELREHSLKYFKAEFTYCGQHVDPTHMRFTKLSFRPGCFQAGISLISYPGIRLVTS